MIDITVESVKANRDAYILVDVREPHELVGNMSLIEGAHLSTLGPDLLQFLTTADPRKAYVFVCRSGHRSGMACELATTFGLSNVFNLKGGMIEWGKKALL